MKKIKMKKTIFLLTLFFALNSYPVFSEDVPEPIIMTKATIEEELQWLQAEAIVFSVSRREQKVLETAAAVYVLSHEDIRRSGANSIPEVLRLVPGLQVAKVNSNTWAISARGFNLRFANKLLVLIDGRTVYNPMFSGVYWNAKDTFLEDVERIEVIRGPGAAMWGANAVNGIINIITKSAADTQGGLVSAGVGNEEKGFGAFRYGGKVNDDVSYRGYVKYFNRNEYTGSLGEDSNDDWEALRGGFRIDGDAANMNSFTLQGDIYNGDASSLEDLNFPFSPYSQRMNVDEDFSGGNILGRWKKTFSDTSDMALQLYFDHEKDTSVFIKTFENMTTTYDSDFQHRFKLNDRQGITWGLGYRHLSTNYKNSNNVVFDPTSRDLNLYSAFIQDEIFLIQDRLKLILGSKFEHNSFTGVEVQPNGRLLWTPHERHSVWASVSRAVRTPSRADHDLSSFYLLSYPTGLPFPDTALVTTIGNEDFDSEELIAYELGYRTKPTDNISLDIAAFYNDYDKLWTREQGTPFIDPSFTHLVIPLTLDNKAYGETYGVEVSAQWQALEWLRLQAAYTYLQVLIHTKSDSLDSDAESDEGISPHNQFFLKSSMDLPMNFELDTFLRYTDNLPQFNIDSYVALDVRLGWNLADNLELSLVGQNLLEKGHPEFRDAGFDIPITEIQRSVYGKVLLRF